MAYLKREGLSSLAGQALQSNAVMQVGFGGRDDSRDGLGRPATAAGADRHDYAEARPGAEAERVRE